MRLQTIRISTKLYEQALEAGNLSGRTASEQIEYWARLGLILEKSLNAEEVELFLTRSSWSLKIKHE